MRAPSAPLRARILRFLRAAIGGGIATLTDLAVLVTLVSLGLSPRLANVPALLAGGVVNFLANRHFAFRAREGSLARQAALYAVVEIVALALNGISFDAAMRAIPAHPEWAAPIRLVTSHLVFLAFSYPLWRLVFRVPERAQAG